MAWVWTSLNSRPPPYFLFLVWCRLLLPKPTIYPTLSDVSKWILPNLQPVENYLARRIWWCWKSSRAHACLQGFHFINIFSVRFAQYNRLLKIRKSLKFYNWWVMKFGLFGEFHKGDFISKNKHVILVSNDSFITQGQRSGSHYFIHPFHLFQIVINIFYKLYRVLSALWNCKFLLWKWK